MQRKICWSGEIGHVIPAALIVMTLVLGGCARQSPVDDAGIKVAVRAKLAPVFGPAEAKQESQMARGADQEAVSHILVESTNGVVTLTGEVQSDRARLRAGQIARSVKQVVKVNNNLAIAPVYSDDAAGQKAPQ